MPPWMDIVAHASGVIIGLCITLIGLGVIKMVPKETVGRYDRPFDPKRAKKIQRICIILGPILFVGSAAFLLYNIATFPK